MAFLHCALAKRWQISAVVSLCIHLYLAVRTGLKRDPMREFTKTNGIFKRGPEIRSTKMRDIHNKNKQEFIQNGRQ